MKYNKIFFALTFSFVFFGCTKLHEDLRGDLSEAQADQLLARNADVGALLKSTYDGLQQSYQDQANVWALQEHTSDEAIPPTRGGDWDDNGIWRVLHTHTWNADHEYITNVFNRLLGIEFNAGNILTFTPSTSQAAEARFLRAFAMFTVLDLYDQVPFREPGENLLLAPKVLKGTEALTYIITELEAIKDQLPDGPATKANKWAARVFLMKCYLNKGVIANRQTPTFAAPDMTQVVTLADQITASGKYSLANNFYDNFARTNGVISTENIFTQENDPSISRAGNNAAARYRCSLHYNNNPDGWNGFTTLATFYDKFEDKDTRKGSTYPGVTDVSGLRVGLLFGQQFNQNGVALQDKKGNPLSFTREVKLTELGNNLEVTGIRVVKYPPDYVTPNNVNNDHVFYRYADVLLMKAEALVRSGSAATALPVINSVRVKRGATALLTVTLDNLLDERGRELYWESWRRQDLIRFGKFLDPFEEKPLKSGTERLLFPIPNQALAVNPNLEQNPGYKP